MKSKIFLLASSFCLSVSLSAQSIATDLNAPSASPAVKDTTSAANPLEIPLSGISTNIGNYVKVCGKVYSVKLLKHVTGTPTLMNVGGTQANERVEVRIQFTSLAKLSSSPEALFLHKDLCISGQLTNQHGFPEITLTPQDQQALVTTAEQSVSNKKQRPKQQPLQTNAYLFAGASLNEPILTHLKQGSIVLPLYSYKKWVYVSVVDKVGGSTPVALAGFVRMQSLKVPRHKKNPSPSLAFN